eukprot:g1149.t1
MRMLQSRSRLMKDYRVPLVVQQSVRVSRIGHCRIRREFPGVVRVKGYSLDDLFDEYAKHEGLDRSNKRTENDPTKSQYDFAKLQQFYPSGNDGSDWIDLPPYNEGPEPGEGPLEKQVGMSLKEAMESNTVNQKHTDYWFTEPPGGWNTKRERVKLIPEEPGFFANAKNPENGRPSITELKPGDVVYGIVTEVWYHHGIKVDIGYEYDGLLPMYKESWGDFEETLNIGNAVKVEVVKIWKHDIYRWPIQLSALDPKVQRFM